MITESSIRVRRFLLSLVVSIEALAPQLCAQAPDGAERTAHRFVKQARETARGGDTAAYKRALAFLDSAEHAARVAPIFPLRAIIGVAYAESLMARARRTHACGDVRRATEMVAVAERAMPNDDLSDNKALARALHRLAPLRDSVSMLRRRSCG